MAKFSQNDIVLAMCTALETSEPHLENDYLLVLRFPSEDIAVACQKDMEQRGIKFRKQPKIHPSNPNFNETHVPGAFVFNINKKRLAELVNKYQPLKASIPASSEESQKISKPRKKSEIKEKGMGKVLRDTHKQGAGRLISPEDPGKESAKALVTAIEDRIKQQNKWELGWFGGESIVIDGETLLVPKGIKQIMSEIQKAKDGSLPYANIVTTLEQKIIASKNYHGHYFFNKRHKSTQDCYDDLAALFHTQHEKPPQPATP